MALGLFGGRTIDLSHVEFVDDLDGTASDLPCPWCGAATTEDDTRCPTCQRNFG